MSDTRRGMQKLPTTTSGDEDSGPIVLQSEAHLNVNTPPQGTNQPKAAGPATTQLAKFSFMVPPKKQRYVTGKDGQMVLEDCTDEEHDDQVKRMRTAAAQLLKSTGEGQKKLQTPQAREPRQASTHLPQVTKDMVQLAPGELVVSKLTLYLTAALALGLLIIAFWLGGILL